MEFDFIVFDVETQLSANEVGGWSNIKDMKIACIVTWDSRDNQYRVYSENGIKECLKQMQEVHYVVGYNSEHFDFTVMSGYTEIDLESIKSFDILKHIEKKLGFKVSLNSCAEATLNEKKSADGLKSIQWWKEYSQALNGIKQQNIIQKKCYEQMQENPDNDDYKTALKTGEKVLLDLQLKAKEKIMKIVEYCKQDVKVTKNLFLFGKENGYIKYINKNTKRANKIIVEFCDAEIPF